jgi:hypothetical protein
MRGKFLRDSLLNGEVSLCSVFCVDLFVDDELGAIGLARFQGLMREV